MGRALAPKRSNFERIRRVGRGGGRRGLEEIVGGVGVCLWWYQSQSAVLRANTCARIPCVGDGITCVGAWSRACVSGSVLVRRNEGGKSVVDEARRSGEQPFSLFPCLT